MGLSDDKVGCAMMIGVVLMLLFFKIALEFEFRVGLILVNDDFGNERIIIVFSVFVVCIDDLRYLTFYCVGFVVISKYFAGMLDVLSLSSISLFCCFVVVETVGVLGPGGDIDFNAE